MCSPCLSKCVFACMYMCVYVCMPFCMHVYTKAWCDREEKAHLSQHALEPSRGQPAVHVLSNEEHS